MAALVKRTRLLQKCDATNGVLSIGLSRQAIFSAVEASLKRLQTDYLDMLQIHRFDASVPIEETMEALHDLVKSGKVRYLGASSMWTYQFAMMQFVAEKHSWTKFVSMQNVYNLLYREEEREMNKFCRETGVGLIPVRGTKRPKSGPLIVWTNHFPTSGVPCAVAILPDRPPSSVKQLVRLRKKRRLGTKRPKMRSTKRSSAACRSWRTRRAGK